MKKLLYLCCLIVLVSCGDDDNPNSIPSGNIAPTDPVARQEFFEEFIAPQEWQLSRFVFDDSARFFSDSASVKDLYEKLPQCRRDITYEWSYFSGIVYIDYLDPEPCVLDEARTLSEGIIIREQDSNILVSGRAEFKGQWDAINKLLNLGIGGPGVTGWNDYDMEWNTIVLAKDSISIDGSFANLNRDVPLPNFSLQFVPI